MALQKEHGIKRSVEHKKNQSSGSFFGCGDWNSWYRAEVMQLLVQSAAPSCLQKKHGAVYFVWNLVTGTLMNITCVLHWLLGNRSNLAYTAALTDFKTNRRKPHESLSSPHLCYWLGQIATTSKACICIKPWQQNQSITITQCQE